jgi:MFS family permease
MASLGPRTRHPMSPYGARLRISPTGGAIGSVLAISLASAMVTPLLPVYAVDSLDASLQWVGLVVSAPFIGLIVVQPFAGQLGDHFGRRPLVLVGVGTMSLATIGYAFVLSLTAVVCLRVAAGAGSGLVIVGTLTTIVDAAPETRRSERVSLYTLATNGGGAMGPLLGGTLDTWLSFSGVVAVSAMIAAFGGLPGRHVTTFPESDNKPESDSERVRLRLSVRGLAHSAAAVPGGLLAISSAGAAAVYTLLPLFLVQLHSSGAGAALTIFALSIVAVRLVGRQWPDRIGHFRCAGIALVLVGVGLEMMSVANSLLVVLIAAAVIGIGHGFAYPSLATAVTLRCNERERATALGTFTALTTAGMVAWSISLGVIASIFGLRLVFVLTGAAMTLGLPLLLRLRRIGTGPGLGARRRRPD